MKTVIIWYRNDLRVHDLPMLTAAAGEADRVVPVFIFDKRITQSKHASANRNRFLLESLEELRANLREKGGELYIREGAPTKVLAQLAQEVKAEQVNYSIDYTPYARDRDNAVKEALNKEKIKFVGYPGRLAIDSVQPILTKNGKVVKVFTPFWRQWQQIERRELAPTPRQITTPTNLAVGELPKLDSLSGVSTLSSSVMKGGETAGRQRIHDFLKHAVHDYHEAHNDMALDGTSRISPYLHFGCLSVREIETMLTTSGRGVEAFHRQLAWRDFYHYILLHYPDNINQELQERYRTLDWDDDSKLLKAWQTGQTGYPVVDAAMRQLNTEGWMHNRARLIVGSFLTKDLLLDWRLGQAYFMKMLLDGDNANNNGNWQWIASVGVDPAPVFRRLYNPTSQQGNYDPTGAYVRRYVPELNKVDDKYLAEPWTMSDDQQIAAKCVIGKDYPQPIVDHKAQRLIALDRYRATKTED